ncbi:MAG: 30S ribosome-binding factor RbfA [Bdellovibrionales bacterium]|nr:30S ribosome-binding factor RbfA [Bdellovibrionales bacterium]
MKTHTPYKRVDRMADLIRQIVSEILITQIHHCSLEGVTVTDVSVTPDLKHAKIYFSVIQRSQVDESKKILDQIRPTVQKKLASQLHTRYTPSIKFVFDSSLEYGNKINTLLDKIKADRPIHADEE